MESVPGVQRFTIAVAGVLLDSIGRVLLIRERYGARQYGLPGGLVQDYESPAETLVREFALQTDVVVGIDNVVGVRYKAADQQSLMLLVYRCRLINGAARVTGHGDIDEVGWYRNRSLPSPMSATVAPAIEAAALGGKGMLFAESPGEEAKRRRFQVRRGG
jgi:ADP-ribose pyrophosphatase YjhB (NUDIX family)